MNSTVFKPICLHGALAVIGLVAATYSNHIANTSDSLAEDAKQEVEQLFQVKSRMGARDQPAERESSASAKNADGIAEHAS